MHLNFQKVCNFLLQFRNYIINAPISVWAVIWYCGILQVIPDVVLCIGAAMLGVRGYKAGIWLKA